MLLCYTTSRYRREGMAGCSDLSVLGYQCEKGTNASAVHLWLDVCPLLHVMDEIPWVQELLRQENSSTTLGKASFSFPEKAAGVWVWPMWLVLCLSGVVFTTHGLGGTMLSIELFLQLELWIWSTQALLCSTLFSWGNRAKGRGAKAGESETILRAVKRYRDSEQEGPNLKINT